MSQDEEANEQTHLLDPRIAQLAGRRRSSRLTHEVHSEDASSIISSHLSKDEQLLGGTATGERLPYNDYTTIDWLHDLVRYRIFDKAGLLISLRSKTPFDIERSIPDEASRGGSCLLGTHVKDGSPRP